MTALKEKILSVGYDKYGLVLIVLVLLAVGALSFSLGAWWVLDTAKEIKCK